MNEVVLSTSTGDAHAYLWDIGSGAVQQLFKHLASDAGCVSGVRWGGMVSALAGKATLHVYHSNKEHVVKKSSAPERLCALQISPDGAWMAAGGVSGRVYVWAMGSGELVKGWDAHYKAVGAVAWSDDGSFLLTGGEDAIIHVWNMCDVLDLSAIDAPVPHSTWTDHALAVTGLVCGVGGPSARVVSCSLDRTCKVWNLSDGTLLRSVLFPAALHSLAMDTLETHVFLGGANGAIFEVLLLPAVPRDAVAAAGAGAGEGAADGVASTFTGHTGPVLSLACSMNGGVLVSGSEDATARVWDIRSKQPIRTFTSHKSAVTNVLVWRKSRDLLVSDDDALVVRPPVVVFRKYVRAADAVARDEARTMPIHVATVTAADNALCDRAAAPGAMWAQWRQFERATSDEARQRQVRSLEKRVRQVQSENVRWKRLSTELLKMAADGGDKGKPKTKKARRA